MASITTQYGSNSNKILNAGDRGLWGPLRRGYPPGVGGPEVHRGGAARVGPVRMDIVGSL